MNKLPFTGVTPAHTQSLYLILTTFVDINASCVSLNGDSFYVKISDLMETVHIFKINNN